MRELVAVIGAGVSGLTSAVLFAEGGYRTRIFAEEIGPRTTSAAAAAIWFPYDCEPRARVIPWSLETFAVLRELSATSGNGVSMIELRSCSRTGKLEIPAWAIPLGARRLSHSFVPNGFTSGFALNVPLTDTTLYLDYLAMRFRRAGGEIHSDVHFERLEEVNRDCTLLVNCTGIGAKALVPDPQLESHRGQVVVVPKIPQSYAVACDNPPLMYAIPRANDCVFGGTNDLSMDRSPDPAATARIIAECRRVLKIARPRVLDERVGLRPFRRSGICLRGDQSRDGRRVIHNYGHGGSGFTVSWGCAHAVLALARRF